MGNFRADLSGIVRTTFTDPLVSLYGINSVSDRVLVIHELRDDHGTTTDPKSKLDGNAGDRIACGIVVMGGGRRRDNTNPTRLI
jgi:Cu-Zn family superoxide dismutase